MSVLLGLALGVLGAFVLEQHDQSFRDVRDLEEALGIKVVGTVPNIPELKTKGRESKMLGFTEFLDDSPAYREMRRTALALLRGPEGGPSSLLLTSARSEEGKSTAATCLALAIAKELPRERVLLVDLDFRKPSLARYLGLSLDAPDMAAVIRERRWIEAATEIELTESMAMWPGASVSGWYFAHPEAQYFVVGRLARDQVEDYAARRGWPLAEAERWLSAYLAYDPED